jgi:predicted phosphodiesterase
MRVAALYDIHGNLPALEAVLQEIRREGVAQLVVGGDVTLGPMPRETLACLLGLDLPVYFIHGNCDLAVLAQMRAAAGGAVTYWGTPSGAPPSAPLQEIFRWTAQQLPPESAALVAGWPKTLQLVIPGLGPVLFCHSTPRSETEVFTRLTPAGRLLPIFAGLGAGLVVCGHTHMQFERMIGSTRVVNAGSVGAPFGEPGADWALLGPGVELRHTAYDLQAAAERIRATRYPQAQEEAHKVLQPPAEAEMLAAFRQIELR